MKKLFSLFIALGFVFVSGVFGQNAVVSISDVVKPAGDIEVPVEVDFTLQDVCSFQLYIQFDESKLTFKGVDNTVLAGISSSDANSSSPILINWMAPFDPGPPPGFVPADLDGKLLDILFEYTGDGVADIEFVTILPNNSAVGDCVLGEDWDNVIFNDGSVSPAPPIPLSNWAVVAGLGLILAFVIVRLGRFF